MCDFAARRGPAIPAAPTAARTATAIAAALAVTLGAPAALALTADEVWQAWQDYAASADTVAAAETVERDGDTLSLSGFSMTGAAEDLTFAVTMDSITLTEESDGTVSVRMSDGHDLTMMENGNRIVIGVSHPGIRQTVSNSDTGLLHETSAPELSITLREFVAEDAPDVFDLEISVARLTASHDVPSDPGGPFTSSVDMGTLNIDVDAADASESVMLRHAVTGATFVFNGAGLDSTDRLEMGDMAGALADGFALAFGVAYDTLRYDFEFVEAGERTAASGRSQAGETRFRLDAQELSLTSESRMQEVTLSGPDMPVEAMGMQAAQLGYGVSLPTSGAADPQPVSLLVRLVDAVLPEEVWALVDPSGALPREPATVVVDLLGEVRLPADLFGMETMFGFMMGEPFMAVEPVSLAIRAVQLRLAGAAFNADGSIAFDASDLETLDGMPRPSGALNMSLQGANTLLESLVTLGVLDRDEALTAGMMLTMFARPGEAPDELLSTVEVREDGSIHVNGTLLPFSLDMMGGP